MCHRVIRTICPSCLRPTAYPQRQRLDQCFPPKVYTGWAPATPMYEKHRTEEETMPEVCNRCRYRELWTWYNGQGDEREEERENDIGKKEVKEADEVKKVGKGKGKGKKKVKNVKNVEWSTTEGEEKGKRKGCEKEKEKLPKNKGKRKAGGVVDQAQQEVIGTKRRRFP
ncbi:hypothetical protein QBC32DRAFT_366205 [Pseudoneurospora amorphoporcata]|uniref:Uncharacterized protein n=1 Tax=Pseudoneurospora amorphoporcata TaxID=241081 RepID=A0AAN6SB80_9PEZI|nr:hypothetical protein QBC32DRAFT_366205 [Pseudoneurospora amorphoporcata]